MRRFLLKSVAFFTILFLVIFSFSWRNIPNSYIISKVKSTSYEKIAWNIDLVNNKANQIEGTVVFFGPSIIEGGICDSTLNTLGLKSINMAVNHPGYELSLYFYNKIKRLKPAKVYFYFNRSSPAKLHPMTPLIIHPKELLSMGQSFNFDFIQYLIKRTRYSIQSIFFLSSSQYKSQSNYGVRYEEAASFDNFENHKTNIYDEARNLQNNNYTFQDEKPDLVLVRIKACYRFLRISFSNLFKSRKTESNFLKTIKKISKESKISYSFIIMPRVHDLKLNVAYKRTEYSDYNEKKTIQLNNLEFLDFKSKWADGNHLSKTGAIDFSKELSKIILNPNG